MHAANRRPSCLSRDGVRRVTRPDRLILSLLLAAAITALVAAASCFRTEWLAAWWTVSVRNLRPAEDRNVTADREVNWTIGLREMWRY